MRLRRVTERHWPLSQRFGQNPALYASFELAGHEGLDFACPVGTPVRACHDGRAEPRWGPVYGDQVWLYGEGMMTLYAHLSRACVQQGQSVSTKDVIGLSGDTGRSTGPHLHLGFKMNGVRNVAYRNWIDPEPWFEKEGSMTKTSLHVQRIQPWMEQATRDLGSDWIKIVNPPAGNDPMPRIANKVVRLWTDSTDAVFIARGELGGREFVRTMLPRWREHPWATCYSLANEPDCNSNKGLANLCSYSMGAMQEASANGIRVVGLECSEASPHNNDLPGDEHIRWKMQQLVPVVNEAIALGHYIGRHCYWRPEVEGPTGRDHALGRVIRDVEYWASMGVQTSGLQLLLTEWGVDGGIAGHTPQQGWRDLYSDPSLYFREIAEGEAMAQRLPWLKAMFLFTAGFEPPWAGFDHDEGAMRNIIAVMPEGGISVPGKLTDAERTRLHDFFATAVPASLKDAIARKRIFVGEMPPNLYVSYDPVYGRYEINKMHPQTWEHIDDELMTF